MTPGDEGIEDASKLSQCYSHIFSQGKNNTLRTLDLSNVSIDWDDTDHFDLSGFTKLEVIDLIGYGDCPSLGLTVPDCLTRLILENVHLQDIQFEPDHIGASLRSLSLSGSNSIAVDDVESIIERAPNVRHLNLLCELRDSPKPILSIIGPLEL
mmetsp:Transcript_7573/g.18668  ORF Transcript_7573/g.18668 Transcript_7573/m.18668 type:complete len:154 (-) Transcript_7573:503-964(-)